MLIIFDLSHYSSQNMAGIIGIKKRLTDDVEQETNTIIRVKKNKLAILAYDEESIANAEDLLRRSAALVCCYFINNNRRKTKLRFINLFFLSFFKYKK